MTTSRIDSLLKQHSSVRKYLTCSHGFMVPATVVYKTDYGDTNLELHEVPVFECLDCDEISYPSGTLLKAIEGAKSHYDLTGNPIYNLKS